MTYRVVGEDVIMSKKDFTRFLRILEGIGVVRFPDKEHHEVHEPKATHSVCFICKWLALIKERMCS